MIVIRGRCKRGSSLRQRGGRSVSQAVEGRGVGERRGVRGAIRGIRVGGVRGYRPGGSGETDQSGACDLLLSLDLSSRLSDDSRRLLRRLFFPRLLLLLLLLMLLDL